MGSLIFFGSLFAFSAAVIGYAVFVNRRRRNKKIKTFFEDGKVLPGDIALTGFHHRGNLSLGQWVFAAVNSERIMIIAEFYTKRGIRVYSYEEYNIDPKNIIRLEAEAYSENKISVKLSAYVSELHGTMDFSLRLAMHDKDKNVNTAFLMLNSLKPSGKSL